MTTHELRLMLKWLRSAFPVGRKVIVRRVIMKRNYGIAIPGKVFRIYLGSGMESVTHTLLHEWAHLMAFIDGFDDHGNRWSYWYGKIYTAWELEYNGKN